MAELRDIGLHVVEAGHVEEVSERGAAVLKCTAKGNIIAVQAGLPVDSIEVKAGEHLAKPEDIMAAWALAVSNGSSVPKPYIHGFSVPEVAAEPVAAEPVAAEPAKA
jgi:hypothetical protein